ncbi:GumC family protein [Pelosinus baikalensis]|uniref:GumC family protein n=1 Tax=Pelosinus baikalensis TaxID=2892015 RepID=A0ABS8HQM7_9FIRM|nr:GumC family protein [Pelosinus baikalensis]MCC5464094.1 GumC family protein [Pelosinus baikalensis]
MSRKMELHDIVNMIKRRFKWILLSMTGAIVFAIVFNMTAAPIYESTVSLRVKYYHGPNVPFAAIAPEEQLKQQINTYAEIIISKTVINEVINRGYADIDEFYRPSYEQMVRMISTQLVNGTELLVIKVRALSPDEAQILANTVLEVFRDKLTEIERSEGKEARIFIGERMEEAKKNLSAAEQAMVDYKKSHQTISVSDQTRSVVERQAEIKRGMIDNQVNLKTAQAKLVNVNQQISQQNIGFIASNPLIEQYKTQLADKEVEMVGLRKNYTANHPKVISLQASIEETKNRLKDEINKISKSESLSMNPIYQTLLQGKLQAEVDIAVGVAQRNAIQIAAASQEQEMALVPEKEQGLARLMRDYTVAEESYTTLAKRYEQARVEEVTQPTNIQVVDRADLQPIPVRPRKALNIIFAAFIGLFMGFSATFVSERLNKTIDTIEDVRRYLGVSFIGSIPAENVKPEPQWKRLISKVIPIRKEKTTRC